MRILYVTYNGLAEPLGRNQVLPYVRGLASRGHQFAVVSFEKKEHDTAPARAETRSLLPSGAAWRALRYHRHPTMPATAWDVLRGIVAGSRMGSFDLIHARGTISALMAAALSWRLKAPWIFDVRGLLAQEYVDARHWTAGGFLARITRRSEAYLLREADAYVFLAQRAVAHLRETGKLALDRPTAVIPCMVDLERFSFCADARERLRAEWDWSGATVIVYSGSLGSWYLPDKMLDLLQVARSKLGDVRLLALTPQRSVVEDQARARGLSKHVRALTSPPLRVAEYLSAADIGVSFIAPAPSKIASSPTKLGEYLACGLPVMLNTGVGDAEDLAGEEGWILVPSFSTSHLEQAIADAVSFLKEPRSRQRARQLAQRRFSLQTAVHEYDLLYRQAAERRRAR